MLDQDFETESEVHHVENQDNDEMKQYRNNEKDSVRKPTKSDAILSKVNSKIILILTYFLRTKYWFVVEPVNPQVKRKHGTTLQI